MISIRFSRWFFAFILIVTLLAGCAGQSASQTVETQQSTSQPAVLQTEQSPSTDTTNLLPRAGRWEGENIVLNVTKDGMVDIEWLIDPTPDDGNDSDTCFIETTESIPIKNRTAEILAETKTGGIAWDFVVTFNSDSAASLTYTFDMCPSSLSIKFDGNGEVKIFKGEAKAIWASAPAEPIVEPTALQPKEQPTATITPIPPTPEPSILIQLGPGKFGKAMWVDVLRGDFVMASGATALTGSSLGVNENWMTFPPGMAIDVVGTTVTLKGTAYPDGSKLIVDQAGNLVPRDGAETAAAVPEPTAEPTTIPAVTKKDIFPTVFLSEPFDNNANQWPVGDVEGQWWTGERLIKNGVLDWDGSAKQSMSSTVSPDSFVLQNSCTSQELNVRVKALNPELGGSFGLRLNSPDDTISYSFLLDPNGYFAFFLITPDAWTPLIDWQISPFMNVGDWNKLSIQAEGSHFKLFINDNLVGEVDDSSLPSRLASLIITANEKGERIQIQFDDFEIRLPATQQAAGCPLKISSEKDDRFSEVLISDSFDDNSSGWPLGDVLTDYWKANRSINNGALTIKGKSITDMYAYAYTEDGKPWDKEVGDQRASVKTRLINPPLKGSYGLILRINENLHSTDFYVFMIDYEGYCAFFKTYKNEWTALVDWKEIESLTPDGWNTLAVEADGDQFRLFINDTLVGEVEDDALAEGRTGVYVETYEGSIELEIQFDDFEILLPGS
jgi:hypothetical protein